MFKKLISNQTAFVAVAVLVCFLGGSQELTAQINNPTGIVLQNAGCQNPCQGQATITGLCHGDYNFEWRNSSGVIISTDSILMDVCEGWYAVTVTPANGGCVCGTLNVYIPSTDLWCWSWSEPVRCNTKGSASVEAFNAIGNVTYLWNNSKTTPQITNLQPGTYTVTVTDHGTQCTSICSVEVEDQSSPLNVTVTTPIVPCGTPITTATASVTGANSGPYTYLWNNGQTTATITNLTPGTYTVTVKDANGCTGVKSKTITLPSQPTASAVSTSTTCGENNGTVTLTTNGAWTVNWSGPNGYANTTTGTTTITALAPGAYAATVTNANGCTAIASAFVADSDKPGNVVVHKTLCNPEIIYGILVTNDLDTTITVNNQTCPYEVEIHATFLTVSNQNQFVSACFGDTVNINGVNYTDDITFTTTTPCLGTSTWTLYFSDAPTVISFPSVHICGGDSAQTYTLHWPVVSLNGCPTINAKREIITTPYSFSSLQTGYDQVCGLVARVDTLFAGIAVNNQTCIIETSYSILETVLPENEDIIQNSLQKCGIIDTVEIRLDSVITDVLNCRELSYYTRIVTQAAMKNEESVSVCDPAEKVWWKGELRGVGISSFFDSTNCIYHILDVNLTIPSDTFIHRISCDPTAVGLQLIPGQGCAPDTTIFTTFAGITEVQIRDSLVCFGDPLTDFNDTITSPNGCLIEQRWNVTHRLPAIGNENFVKCIGETLEWNGLQIQVSGTYTVALGQNNNGCDTSAIAHVQFITGSTFARSQDTCDISLNGQTFWEVITSGSNGCTDSILVTYKWTPAFYLDTTVIICKIRPDGNLWVRDTIKVNGCWGISDTVFNYSPSVERIAFNTCNSNNTGEWIIDTIVSQSLDSCDIVKIGYWDYNALMPTQLQSAVYCEQSTYVFEGSVYSAPAAGESVTLQMVYETIEGCDSIVMQTVTGLPRPTKQLYFQVCPDEDASWNGEFFPAGTYVRELSAQNGCDTLLTIVVEEINWSIQINWPSDTLLTAKPGMLFEDAQDWLERSIGQFNSVTIFNQDTFTTFIKQVEWVNDSTAQITYGTQSPCGEVSQVRSVKIRLVDIPLAPCDIQILQPGLGNEVWITVTPLENDVITDVNVVMYSVSTGSRVQSQAIEVGTLNTMNISQRAKGEYALHLRGKVNGEWKVLAIQEPDGRVKPVVHKVIKTQ